MNQDRYIPGVCNIGKDEIARRAAKLRFSLLLFAGAVTLLFLLPFNAFLFAFIVLVTAYSSILIFQIQQKFCILYGWMHVFNFKEVAEKKSTVADEEWRKKDRAQVLKILSYSLLSTALISYLIWLVSKGI